MWLHAVSVRLTLQAYLRTKEGDAGTVIDYRNWQLSLGRRFRSLKLWFVLRSYGVEGFKGHISSVRLYSHLRALSFQIPDGASNHARRAEEGRVES